MAKASLTLVLTALRDMGISAVYAYYSGGGDSGAIEYVHGLPESCITRNEQGILESYENDDDLKIEIPDNLKEPIEEAIYNKILDGVEDWYNNEGGYGEVVLCTTTGSWLCDNNQYYTEVNNYSHDGTLSIEE